jgi:hypothetical protein
MQDGSERSLALRLCDVLVRATEAMPYEQLNAPGLEVVAHRTATQVATLPTGGGRYDDMQISESDVLERFGEDALFHPEMRPEDVLILRTSRSFSARRFRQGKHRQFLPSHTRLIGLIFIDKSNA